MKRTLQIPTAEVFLPLLEPSRYKGAFGGRGCVHGDTMIHTPGGDIPIKSFNGGWIYSIGVDGVEMVMAGSSVQYPPEDLYKVTLESGQSVICTMGHKFMTDFDWTSLQGLSHGSFLRTLATSHDLRESYSFSSQSVLPANVPHYLRAILGFLYCYYSDLRLCGVQLPSHPKTYRDVVRILADEQQHNYHASMREDDQDNENKHNLSLFLHHPSNLFCHLSEVVQNYGVSESYNVGTLSELLLVFYQCVEQSQQNKNHAELIQALAAHIQDLYNSTHRDKIQQIISGMLALSVDDSSFSDSLVGICNHSHFTTTAAIQSITYYGNESFYDIFVPINNNYISDDIIHHNSGKSQVFADMLIEQSLAEPGESGEGLRSVCIREVQKDLAQSSKLLIESKIKSFGITEADGFKIFRDVITTPKDGLIIFKGMNDYTADSIKSLEGFKRAWWEESQTATAHSLNLLRPTIRAKDSELWFSWNPRRKTDPVDVMLRGPSLPTDSVVVRANWRDNPWFPKELEQERLDCMRTQPDQYDHIWEGGYVSVIDGAYYAMSLTTARAEGRIGRVGPDPLMTYRVFCDIGGTGARADSFTMWVAQFIGREIRVLNYYEAVGQPFATHLGWLREHKYNPSLAQVWLPHDGDQQDKVFDVSYASAFRDAGYDVTVVPNQGKGAAKARIEAGRRRFPIMWFNEATTEPGLAALGWYHEKKDESRNIGLGPEHDWSSHGADSFGLMCIVYESPDEYEEDDYQEEHQPKNRRGGY